MDVDFLAQVFQRADRFLDILQQYVDTLAWEECEEDESPADELVK